MISVITVTFNNFEEFLATQVSLDAVANIERVVVNGGSCQRTQKWLSERNDILYISEPDDGISDAFNKGVALSTRDYIAFLHSGDNLLDPEYYKRAYQFLETHPDYSFVHGNMVFVDRLTGPLFMRPSLSNIGRGMPYWHVTMVTRRSVFSAQGVFQNKYRIAMDYDWVCRLYKAGLKGFYDDGPAVLSMDGSGVSATGEGKAIKECWRALKENSLVTPGNALGYVQRWLLYNLRQLLSQIGLSRLLGELKKFKHTS